MAIQTENTGNNEHYVPRWYQRLISEDKNKINCVRFNEFGVRCGERSIDSTCSGQYYYGPNTYIDSILRPLENKQSQIFRKIVSTGALPAEYTDEHIWILISLVVFLTRTEAALAEYQSQFQKAQEYSGLAGAGLSHDQMIERSIVMYPVIGDLGMVLLTASHELKFIGSDSPVQLLNPLMFGSGVEPYTGLASKGIVIVFPLNSNFCLMLYDQESYDLDEITPAECEVNTEQLNELQTLAAHEFIFHRDGNGRVEKDRLEALRMQRDKGPHQSVEYGDGNRYMLSRTVDYMPKLGFLHIRDGALKEREKHKRWLDLKGRNKNLTRSKALAMIRHSSALQELVDSRKLKLSELHRYIG